ncbi:LrgB family protein [Porticoccaceae bacterium]|nr:LrgB family protein [Porticoccaceae bacterium]
MQQWQLISGTSWPLILTICGFAISFRLYQHFGQNSLLHPLLIATPLIYLAMRLIELDFSAYYQGNGVLNWLLGPATVALAVPLSQQLRQIPRLFKPLTIALLLGGLFATFINLLLVKLFGLSDTILLSLAAKSVTSPIAIGLTQQIGGLASLLAVATMITGLIGIVVAKSLFRISNIDDDRWQGVILGVTAHAIGTAKAFESSPRCGAFATLGMGLNGIWTSFFLPTSISLFIT